MNTWFKKRNSNVINFKTGIKVWEKNASSLKNVDNRCYENYNVIPRESVTTQHNFIAMWIWLVPGPGLITLVLCGGVRFFVPKFKPKQE